MISDAQGLVLDKIIELYQIDFSTAAVFPDGWTGPTNAPLYMSSTVNPDFTAVQFGGITYDYVNAELTGISMETGGKIPQPTFKLKYGSERPTGGWIFKFYNNGGDYRGVKITRIRTTAKHLDNGSEPSTNMLYAKTQTFYVDQVSKVYGNTIELRLSTGLGLDSLNDKTNRVMSSNQCNLKYRVWSIKDASFKYTSVADGGCPWGQASEQGNFSYCPSWGTPYFDANGNSVASPAQDRCSLSVEGCLKRFPVTDPLQPFPISINLKGGTKGT